jgi:hypothetical protein
LTLDHAIQRAKSSPHRDVACLDMNPTYIVWSFDQRTLKTASGDPIDYWHDWGSSRYSKRPEVGRRHLVAENAINFKNLDGTVIGLPAFGAPN